MFALIYTAIQRIFLIINNLVYFLTGILLGEVIKHEPVSKLHLTHYLGWSTLMFILVAVTYYTIIMIGLDPFWSIAKAVKWCANKDWVHPDTSLFFSIVRDISTLSGIVL